MIIKPNGEPGLSATTAIGRHAVNHPSDNQQRRRLLSAAAAAMLAAPLARNARAQSFPSRPIKLIVPFPPGSTTDIPVRAMAVAAGRILGVQIVVENRPGATATLGPVSVAQSAAPDGYTLTIAPSSLWRLPHMQKVTFDPLKDFTYIAGLAAYTYGVAVMNDRPWKTLAELVTHAKVAGGNVTMGGVGVGGSGHIACFRLARATGAEFRYVPFKGGAEVTQAMQGGHIDGTTDGAWSQLVQGGKARLLAAFTEKRLPKYPDVPTARELGYDVVANAPWGLAGPRGMDPAVVKTLQQAFLAAREDPAVQTQMTYWDLQPLSLDSEAFTALAARQYSLEKRNLEDIQFKPE